MEPGAGTERRLRRNPYHLLEQQLEETEPTVNPPFWGSYTGTVDKMERADILIMRYGRGANRGKMLYRLQTET